MSKKLSSIVLMGFCALMFSTTSLTANENMKEHSPIGTRAESIEKRMAQLETRSQMATLNPEEAKKPSKKQRITKSALAMKSMSPLLAQTFYYTSHPAAYQTPASVCYYGYTVELVDGSVWKVDPSDSYLVTGWHSSHLVVITPNHSWFSPYAFRLTNQHTGESVAVNLDLGPIAPIYASYYTHWIVNIDYYNNIVYLEDGSVWYMSSFDSNIVNQWISGDVVIIGVNDGWLFASNPNVLINVAMLNFAAGAAVF
jgi:hypothetical protein